MMMMMMMMLMIVMIVVDLPSTTGDGSIPTIRSRMEIVDTFRSTNSTITIILILLLPLLLLILLLLLVHSTLSCKYMIDTNVVVVFGFVLSITVSYR